LCECIRAARSGCLSPHSTPEPELHAAEKRESYSNRDPRRDGCDACASDQMHDCQQKETQTDGQIPPSPPSRLKSAHPTLFNQLRRTAAPAYSVFVNLCKNDAILPAGLETALVEIVFVSEEGFRRMLVE
jgi:hypothetical protein